MDRSYDPYNKGRWYRFFIESDGDIIKLTESDIAGAVVSGTRIKTVDNFHITDVKYDITSVEGGTASGIQNTVYIYADGIQAFNIPAKDQFTSAYIYVFGHYES